MGRVKSAARTARRPVHAKASARPLRCAIVTVSDTRGEREDRSGATIARLLERSGHGVAARAWVRDEIPAIRRAVRAALARRTIDMVIVTGGTGIAPRDVTPEAVEPLFDRALPGFGEQFRALSWSAVGSLAWLSRASAGIARGRLVVVLPGSPAAVELGLQQILIPELGHIARLLGRFEPGD